MNNDVDDMMMVVLFDVRHQTRTSDLKRISSQSEYPWPDARLTVKIFSFWLALNTDEYNDAMIGSWFIQYINQPTPK
jgi:hypothetical protein